LSLVNEGPRKEDIKIAEHRVEQNRAILAASEERFKDTSIYAPVAGIVLRKNVELGETVAPGVPVFTIGDLKNPWIKVYVKEDKLALVKQGQKATITVDTYKGKSYEGIVSYISSEAEFTPKTVQTREERVKLVFAVKVRAKNEKGELKPGMPADVNILLNP
jgi:HlyD family secretion protein